MDGYIHNLVWSFVTVHSHDYVTNPESHDYSSFSFFKSLANDISAQIVFCHSYFLFFNRFTAIVYCHSPSSVLMSADSAFHSVAICFKSSNASFKRGSLSLLLISHLF